MGAQTAFEALGMKRTDRGFAAPTTHAEKHRHRRDELLIVRLSQYEHDLLRPGHGVVGKFCLISNDDGSFDLVKYADA